MDIFTIKQWLFLMILGGLAQNYILYIVLRQHFKQLLSDHVELAKLIKECQ